MSTPELGFLTGQLSGQHDPEKPDIELTIAVAFEITDECQKVSPDTSRAVIVYLEATQGCIVQISLWQERAINQGPRGQYFISGDAKLTQFELESNQHFRDQALLLGIAPLRLAELVFELKPVVS